MLTNSSASHVRSAPDPANSAKPGVFFSPRGVQAVRQNDFRYAIDRYQVAASWGYRPAEYNLGVIYFKGGAASRSTGRGDGVVCAGR